MEVCSTVAAVKYLYKYVTKGSDRAVFTVEAERDEIKDFQNARYIGPCEACWRIFEFDLLGRSPAVVRLPVHLPKQQTVVYAEGAEADAVEGDKDSKLMAFFKTVFMEVCTAAAARAPRPPPTPIPPRVTPTLSSPPPPSA